MSEQRSKYKSYYNNDRGDFSLEKFRSTVLFRRKSIPNRFSKRNHCARDFYCVMAERRSIDSNCLIRTCFFLFKHRIIAYRNDNTLRTHYSNLYVYYTMPLSRVRLISNRRITNTFYAKWKTLRVQYLHY